MKGGFTLPGEAGYEKLTLQMAEKWGADVIRDSDGTTLSQEILDAGYGIYSTVCVIRDHNDWVGKHPDMQQQTFLMSDPKMADHDQLAIRPLEGYFEEQFRINDSEESLVWWQVFDRTADREVPGESWSYDKEKRTLFITNAIPWHIYTVNFLAYRIWEEISMYNHTTNHWDKEHLMQIDPRYPQVQEYLLKWMENWCEAHPATTVVRFTSMFYNFVWIWGQDERRRNRFTDWGSYDFTVSPAALREFEQNHGYRITSEDFINKGRLHVTHMPPDEKKKDWMDFVNDFVVEFGSRLVDVVHRYGKQAYVFYDDSWVGVEPYHKRFSQFRFDGIIKAVFSGYEVRLSAGVPVQTHEIRLHPYLFPTGLGGEEQFIGNGDPTRKAKEFWTNVRRALLREPVERIGLGGYLHLTEPYPDFCDYIGQVVDEFRRIRSYHQAGRPYCLKPRVAVLHSWGSLRPWTLSGHFHETFMHDLIHVNESLSGLPFEVSFLNFDDVRGGALKNVDVVINAGYAGSAWSGGDAWKDEKLLEQVFQWVYEGGAVIGIGEPSAVEGYADYFRLAPVLGVDMDTGAKVCHGKWQFEITPVPGLLPGGCGISPRPKRYLTDPDTKVLMAFGEEPVLAAHAFGKGKGIYLASYEITPENTRLLQNLILYAAGQEWNQPYLTDNPQTECTYFPDSHVLAVINNSPAAQNTRIATRDGNVELRLAGFESRYLEI
ncbi:1,3-beta-galactosyl-N-acetylhexosamine phosphorylase [Diplocloster agilis]|uniref:1,3-beta-galactosyl-N-acetylhexosamine phosphorylase n=1 Tax=Diplocloster agilis TaxID=2850323 RepID=A0A949K328_9FIRM|nr:1,3-beta-galactosyl-N-acetylhexosamine phosphorylase [Diplocloster agilis]MBU9738432.1 1,3-beta-galactosyl-N-acetylhexosamine phosphorylase [Diplocloster agilis]